MSINFRFQISDFRFWCFSLILFASCCLTVFPQKATRPLRIALIFSSQNEITDRFSDQISKQFEKLQHIVILDDSLAKSAAKGFGYKDSLNLTNEEAKNLGTAIGCDFYILGKIQTQRRTSFKKEVYYESYTFIFVVSSKTGKLVSSQVLSAEGDSIEASEKLLIDSINTLTNEITDKLSQIHSLEKQSKQPTTIEILPDEPTENFRTPLPYKRIKPEYTKQANSYFIEATVDILVDIDENGYVTHTEIVRWAGFGLDESVETTVKKMNFRSALRDGKAIPLRFLLRYNFRKPESNK